MRVTPERSPHHPATKLIALVRLGRPLFLGGGFILYGLGAAVAWAGGVTIDATRYAVGQAVVTAFQLMTHYANDFFDLEADRANTTPTRWSGGSRVLLSGTLAPSTALAMAVALAIVGVVIACAGWLSGSLSGGAFVVLLSAGVLAWFYSAPPLRLLARGWGEAVTAFVVAGLVPCAAFLNARPAGDGLGTLGLALVVPAALQFAMLLAIEFPDAVGDEASGKKTLVVRLGGARAARLCLFMTVAGFVALPGLVWMGLPVAAAAGMAVLAPVAIYRAVALARGDWAEPRRWESLTFWAVALLALTSAAELAGFLWTGGAFRPD